MSKLVVWLESKDPAEPARQGKESFDPEELLLLMRELTFRLAMGEFGGIYIARENPLKTQ